MNQDEASIGYDAYAILHYGIDRSGVHLPIHLTAWGSGQNALYAYLSMPFLLLFGLTPLSVRALSAVMGLIGMLFFYLIMKAAVYYKNGMHSRHVFYSYQSVAYHDVEMGSGIQFVSNPDFDSCLLYSANLSFPEMDICFYRCTGFVVVCLWYSLFFCSRVCLRDCNSSIV
ncbi:hypothetical protein [Paenibacillus ihuae]|uniref:hypothetical protein n=1 Tax=Paenibacillus ihuae TaxID=1232431 RepID=UPI0011DDAD32|nr:hypothetical protein [Paenibacillus ihuae]